MNTSPSRADLTATLLSMSASHREKREALRQLEILDRVAKEERMAEERAIFRAHWAQRIAGGK